MDRAKDLVHPQPVFHRQNELGDQVGGMGSDNRHTKDPVPARLRQDLDETAIRPVGNRAVQIVDTIGRHLMRDALFLCLGHGQAHAGDLGVGEGGPGDDPVIRPEPFQIAEKRVDGGEPGLMGGGMGELIGSGDIPGGEDVGEQGFEIFVRFDHAAGRDAKRLKPIARQPGRTTDGDDDLIETDAAAAIGGFDLDPLFAIRQAAGNGAMAGQDRDPVRLKRGLGQGGNLRVLTPHDAGGHLDLRHLRAEPLKRLRQFGPDRPAAKDDQPRRRILAPAQLVPKRVGGEEANLRQPRNLWHEGCGAGRQNDGAGGQAAGFAALNRDLDRPGVDQPRMALDDLDAKAGVARDAVMRFDPGDDVVNTLHHCGEIHLRRGGAQAVPARPAYRLGRLGAGNQGLGRDAAIVQAVAPHLPRLDDRDLRLRRSGDIGGDEPRRPRPDHDQVPVEGARPFSAGIDPFSGENPKRMARDPGEDAQQREGQEQGQRQQVPGAANGTKLRPCIHIDRRPGQHSDLADDIEGDRADRRQPHQQVDRKERHDRDQAQGKKVERPVPLHPRVHGFQPRPQLRTNPVAQKITRRQKGQGRPDGRGEGNQDQPAPKPEQRPGRQCHPDRKRQRQRRDGDIAKEEQRGEKPGRAVPPGLCGGDKPCQVVAIHTPANRDPQQDHGDHKHEGDHEFSQDGPSRASASFLQRRSL